MLNRWGKSLAVVFACIISLIFAACDVVLSYSINEIEVDAEIEKGCKIVYINDLHMQIYSDEISEENRDFMAARINEFSTDGISTAERWNTLPQAINKLEPDFVVFGGDIIDFCSEANIEALKSGLNELESPYMYLRSDHDVEPYWLLDSDSAKCMELQNSISECESVMSADLGEIIVLGINFSQNNISKAGIEMAKQVFSAGKPIILATHIPYEQAEETSLKEFSEKARNGRHLYWGVEGEKYPDENTIELMNMIYAEDSPVVAVLAGHLHDKWEGALGRNNTEYVFAPCYQGNIGVVTIK